MILEESIVDPKNRNMERHEDEMPFLDVREEEVPDHTRERS